MLEKYLLIFSVKKFVIDNFNILIIYVFLKKILYKRIIAFVNDYLC